MAKHLILREWLDYLGISLRKLADNVPGESPTYRAIDEASRRRNANLNTANAIVTSLNELSSLDLKIDDVFISEDTDPNEYIEQRIKQLKGSDVKNVTSSNRYVKSVISGNKDSRNRILDKLGSISSREDGEDAAFAEKLQRDYLRDRFTFKGDIEKLAFEFFSASAVEVSFSEEDEWIVYDFIKHCGANQSDREKIDNMLSNLFMIYTNPEFKLEKEYLAVFADACSLHGFKKHMKFLLKHIEI